MCNSKPTPPPRPLIVETTEEKGGLHFEGVHEISFVLSSGAVIAIIVIIVAWCLIRRRDNCCKRNEGENSVRIQIPSAPQPTAALLPPMPSAPPSDIELALFRMQENEKQRQLQQNHLQLHLQQQEVQRQSQAMTPGRQLALANQFPVV